MIIKRIRVNNKKRSFEIDTKKGNFSLPFSRLRLVPTKENRVKEIYVDREVANRGITYVLDSGEEDTIHIDAFLDYNRDPDFMRKLTLFKLTVKANEIIKESKLAKREISRKLRTSPSQLYRLLDTANYKKTIDQMVKLLSALNYQIDIRVKPEPRPKSAA